MPRYFFNLNDGEKIIPDVEGTELPDDESARAHAALVVGELARNRERETRSWRLAVCDAQGTQCFEQLFASIEDSISQSSPMVNFLLEDDGNEASRSDAIEQVRALLSSLSRHAREGREGGDLGAA
jgi:hypothetical protein